MNKVWTDRCTARQGGNVACCRGGRRERCSSVRRRRPEGGEEGGRGAERDDGLIALPMFRSHS